MLSKQNKSKSLSERVVILEYADECHVLATLERNILGSPISQGLHLRRKTQETKN